jgi:hypothetical protein
MKTRLIALSCCIAMAAIFAYAQNQNADEGYQMATVAAFERVAASAQHMENEDNYKITMRLNGTLYYCRTSGPAATFIDWITGKQFPSRVNGKVFEVKNPDGQVLDFNIVNTKIPK